MRKSGVGDLSNPGVMHTDGSYVDLDTAIARSQFGPRLAIPRNMQEIFETLSIRAQE